MKNDMNQKIFCTLLKQELPALDQAPFPGELGARILKEISKPAWDNWLSHQTMLINEYRLSLIDSGARDFLKQEMQKYFFGEGSEKPSGFQTEA